MWEAAPTRPIAIPLTGWVARAPTSAGRDGKWVTVIAVCVWGTSIYALVAPPGAPIMLVEKPEMKIGYPE